MAGATWAGSGGSVTGDILGELNEVLNALAERGFLPAHVDAITRAAAEIRRLRSELATRSGEDEREEE